MVSQTVNGDGSVTVNLSGTWTWAGQKCAGRWGEGWAVDWFGISTSSTPSPSFAVTNATEVVFPPGTSTTTGTVTPVGAIPIKGGTFFHVGQYYAGEIINSPSTCIDTSTGSTGSWSASATYPSASDIPAQLCVNMYDEHGSEGKQSTNATDFSPSKDGDNSIQTNAFVPSGGSCVSSGQPPKTPTLVQSAHAISGEVSSISAGLTQAPAAGDVLIVEVGTAECVSPTTSGSCTNPTTTSVSDSAGNVFTKVATIKAPDGAEESVWTAHVTSTAGPDTVTAIPSSSPADMGLSVVEYSGIKTTTDPMGTGQRTTAGSTGTANSSAAKPQIGDLVLGLEMDSGWQTTVSPGSGFAVADQSGPNSNMDFLIESRIASTTSVAASAGLSSSLSFPFSGTGGGGSTYTVNGVPWAMVTIAFQHS